MRIRGDLRNTIQTISPHSTPPIGIESTMFFDFYSAGGPPPKALLPDQTGPPLPAGRFRQTGLSRLVSAYSTTGVWLSCHSVESVTELIFIMEPIMVVLYAARRREREEVYDDLKAK